MSRLSAKALRVYGKRKAVTEKAMRKHSESIARRTSANSQVVLAVLREVFPDNDVMGYPREAREEINAMCRAAFYGDSDTATLYATLRQGLSDVVARNTPVKHWAQR